VRSSNLPSRHHGGKKHAKDCANLPADFRALLV
jgi:hypothetical protein